MATGDFQEVPREWMPASGVEPLVQGDPVLIWLKYHGSQYGFHPEKSPYEFIDFIGAKARQFEEKWVEEMAPDAVRVCANGYEVRSVAKVRETIDLMQKRTPILVQPALWWAPARIYGTPDLLVHTSWLQDHYPQLVNGSELLASAPALTLADRPSHYVVFDMKFTSELDSAHKARDLASYAAQVRLYSYMVGRLQGMMPRWAYLVTRDRIFDPIPIEITSTLDQPLDRDLAILRNLFVEIKVNGARYVPWRDAIVAVNAAHRDDRWQSAKRIIAGEKAPGGDPTVVYQISPDIKKELSRRGFPTLDSLLQADPEDIPFEQCNNLGEANSRRIRAILEANRSGSAVVRCPGAVPPRKEFEFYVDFEYFSNVNVDFDRQWPALDGCEMVFMIGLGWEEEGQWTYESFVASAESHDQERTMLERFIMFLDKQTDGAFTDGARASLYHWTPAEAWQADRASDRHCLADDYLLRHLPWCDLQRVFLDGPIGLPGAWTYKLKHVAMALADLDPDFDFSWPGQLDGGLRAMVMGWKAYQALQPLESAEMATLGEYLEADCRALWGILRWVRSWVDRTCR
jgi:hypothetical protein